MHVSIFANCLQKVCNFAYLFNCGALALITLACYYRRVEHGLTGRQNGAFYSDDMITIYRADSTHLDVLDDTSIDLTITSTPYILDVLYDGFSVDLYYGVYLLWV